MAKLFHVVSEDLKASYPNAKTSVCAYIMFFHDSNYSPQKYWLFFLNSFCLALSLTTTPQSVNAHLASSVSIKSVTELIRLKKHLFTSLTL